jgi:ribonuclease Z
VSGRSIITLGTASQVPTRDRAHHATLLQFDGHGVLFDPGEGTQRQLTLAGVPASRIHQIYITHAHGDHCLGLPGVLQRLALDGVTHAIDVYYPLEADHYIRRLREASAYRDSVEVRLHPSTPGLIAEHGPFTVRAAALEHAVPTLGYRLETHPTRRLDPLRAEAAGVEGPDRARLLAAGHLDVDGRVVSVEEVSELAPPVRIAFVMDTRWCDGAMDLAADADALVVEATFLETERALAAEAGHLTAGQAARLGAEAGVGRAILTHLSQRYPTIDGHLAEARAAAPGLAIDVARDLDRFTLDRRAGPVGDAAVNAPRPAPGSRR